MRKGGTRRGRGREGEGKGKGERRGDLWIGQEGRKS